VIGESHLEQLIFLPLAEAGIDLPIPQYEVTVSGQRFRLDYT
jgi:hypothetical protein